MNLSGCLVRATTIVITRPRLIWINRRSLDPEKISRHERPGRRAVCGRTVLTNRRHPEAPMVVAPRTTHIAAAALVALAAAVPTAGTQAQSIVGLAEGDGIFIDGRNFEILHRNSRSDARDLVNALGAREIGPGAIVFRSGDKLYIVDAPAGLPAVAGVAPISVAYEAPKNPE